MDLIRFFLSVLFVAERNCETASKVSIAIVCWAAVGRMQLVTTTTRNGSKDLISSIRQL